MAAGLASTASATTAASNPSAHAPLRVQVASFNFNLQGTTVPFPDLQSWLVPTISETRNEYTQTSMSQGREAPDIYAVGFQELLPLHMAFANSEEANDAREHTGREIRRAVRHHAAVTRPDGMYPPGQGPEDYTVIAEVHLVSISLYVLGRNKSGIPSRVKEVRTSTASTGFFNLLGNKGGVGARVVLNSSRPGNSTIDTQDTEEVLTFVCAHLTAHDHNTQRRNQDYKTIISRLAFPPESAIAVPIPLESNSVPAQAHTEASKIKEQYEATTNLRTIKQSQAKTGAAAALDKKTYSFYDTHHAFFFGDLNYRISLGTNPSEKNGESLTKSDLQRKLTQEGYSDLVRHRDQLTQQHGKNKVLQGLIEYPLEGARIPPTYKYKPVRKTQKKGSEEKTNKSNELSPKRIPGWTDRIFWASDKSNRDHHGADVELFRSLMSYQISDHKPITILLSLPQPASTRQLLSTSNPYSLDPSHAMCRRVGTVLDRIVGYIWSILVLLGAGNMLLGASQIVVAVALAAYFVLGRGGEGGDFGYWLASLGLRP